MGLFSLFSSDSKLEIENCKKRIENFQKQIETIKKNNVNKTQAHYRKSAKEKIDTLKYQIKKEKEKISNLKK
ncbi:hypothetical protein NYQ10_17455 [Flavobacterium johnsoniae]|uniref:hypothetical protein n=1 Tax=Flavobacterium johnsoniae TaxID=986 RepID=UPI0025AF760B|nr:hypothetical protein [Flavobacterium johnsoniae]WJS93875.1 hypothetical protein NYQ10_17455 [Flavobacterium johnsoniae]